MIPAKTGRSANWKWKPVEARADADFVVAPDERLSWPRTIGLGAQHVVAMFGATFLVPVLTGFPPATTLLFSGVGTILFLIITGNRLPSYLGSSFSVIAPVTAAVASEGTGSALGGIVALGLVLIVIGGVVHLVGTRWLDVTLPPVVTGAIVALIGFNLAPAAKTNFEAGPVVATVTLVLLVATLAFFRGMIGRLAIFLAVLIGYLLALAMGDVDTSAIAAAPWVGLPDFEAPSFSLAVLPMFLPAVVALIAENIGHVKSVGQMTRTDMDPLIGRALAADGVATTLAGFGGGSATTTYAENIGVMAATRVYSTAAYWVAAVVAIALSLCPKIGAAISATPAGVLGGATVVLYGLVGVLGVRIWLTNHVDFSLPVNQMTAAIPLIIGIADFTWQAGELTFTGIALGSIAALLVYHGMRLLGLRTSRSAEPSTSTV
ncbi:uracil-xanthine permease family protein [Mycolicibacterium monacense]|uniref:Pyrimidine permease RutG n=4 Tax=Mycobacteriaceae TaxID=1762 RepID=A0AAD1IXN2_MYCMB|nr:solute carrier family 23 protein [Mycolicibacterium monacense]MDA4100105.1 nitrate reductase [Mycolicibacterium monacense DSM 44395]OBB73148.1 nitrate reductase [Mycolicibacterium monacense]ORB20295.1 nitrate reductase [Mycolicibacterium monacense DSM 44395]QHP84403.1 nitrate reductase [Mycolicibacterium monacense DSM 44395]BBZ62839.1 pyrimidine permease RutG [Mycolicibacterium monacense]